MRSPAQSVELLVLPRRRFRRARRWLIRGIAGVATLTVLAFVVPAAFGLSRCTIGDDAMSATMKRGSVVFTKPCLAADLRVGDVITYPLPTGSRDALITRRIADIRAGEIWTSSDRTGAVDPWTIGAGKPSQARVVADVPYAGYVFDGLTSGTARLRRVFSVLH